MKARKWRIECVGKGYPESGGAYSAAVMLKLYGYDTWTEADRDASKLAVVLGHAIFGALEKAGIKHGVESRSFDGKPPATRRGKGGRG